MKDSRLLTADELAARLRVSPATVREWARRKQIPSIRISHKIIRYDFADVVASLKQTETESEVSA